MIFCVDVFFYFGWLIMVDFGRFGLVGSVCVLCCDGAERSVLVLLRLGFVPCSVLGF